MGLLAQATDYTDKDFDSLRLRLQSLVGSVFPDWTDFNVANFGNILLEMYAFVGDVLGFYQDNQARESRLLTATQRKNLIGLRTALTARPLRDPGACARVHPGAQPHDVARGLRDQRPSPPAVARAAMLTANETEGDR